MLHVPTFQWNDFENWQTFGNRPASPIWADWLGFFMRTIFQDLPTFWRFFQTLKVRICWKSRKFFPNPQNDHQKQKQHKFTAFWQMWMITGSLRDGNLHRKWLNVMRLFHVPSSPYHAKKTPLLLGLSFKKHLRHPRSERAVRRETCREVEVEMGLTVGKCWYPKHCDGTD